MKKLVTFIKIAIKDLGDFFKDRFSFLSEAKIWATIFLLAIPVGAFLLSDFDIIAAGLFLAFALSLMNGSLVGDHIAPLRNLKGLGILDLMTNKANKFDLNRVLGHVVFLSVLIYVFQPIWIPEVVIRSELVGLLGTIGVAIFGIAPHSDAVAVAKIESAK